ncbi:Ent-kaurene synthase 2, chloroplastic [Linum grandiflorum]
MVPSTTSPKSPHFPGCINWILENQQKDGAWGVPNLKPEHTTLLLKDNLSSTLACVLALKRWGIGHQHINNALGFIERNSTSLTDSTQQTPIGFDIVFPSMVEAATQDFNLNLPLNASEIDRMLQSRDSLLQGSASARSHGHNAYLAYISEGMRNFSDWETAMSFQRNNGSLFNSPSATAAAFLSLQDSNSLNYLQTILDVQGNTVTAVPSIYPHGILARLNLIDAIENLGIDCHFRDEIKEALDEIYTCWQRNIP